MNDPNIIGLLAGSGVVPSLAHLGVGALALGVLLYFIRGTNRHTALDLDPPLPEREEQLDSQRLRFLARLVGAPGGEDVLLRLADYVETALGGRHAIHCCVLLLAERSRLQLAAAPSLPAEFAALLHGADVRAVFGPAPDGAWDPQPLLVPDIQADARFEALRTAAQGTSLCSCWTVPIRDESGRALGVVAAYGRQRRQPHHKEIFRLYEASHLAAIELSRRRTVAQLQARERELRALIERSPDSIARYDRNCHLRSINAQGVREAALPLAELVGRRPSEFPSGPSAMAYEIAIAGVVADGRPAEFELDWTNAAGRKVHSHIRLEPERDDRGEVTGVLAVSRDVSRIVGWRQRLHELAYEDALTGLPNRARLKELLDVEAHGAAQRQGVATLMVLGLDRFKAINDSFGRGCGDALLRATSQRLSLSLEPTCVVARLEGDEFAILLPATEGDDHARPRILDTLATPFHVGDVEIRLTACLGIAEAPEHGTDAEELLRCATMALHHAKLQGRGRAHGYEPALTAAAQNRLAIEADMRKAIAAGEFELLYQPKVDLASGRIVGAEALLRWHHPKRGLLSPQLFVPLAEESGLIGELGGWVLREACLAARRWNEGPGPRFPVAVNLSAQQFTDGRLADKVRRTLAETGCRPDCLQLEITESLLLEDDPGTREVLERLTAAGISIAIDDFGTGYSALAYLARFPIDTLKIDRSFVAGVVDDADSAELVRAIVAMARSLRMTVVAEGVESAAQAAFLKDAGCALAQGFLYGAPADEAAFAALLPPLRPPAASSAVGGRLKPALPGNTLRSGS